MPGRGTALGEAQSFSVKRAQVEFHNFASLGEPDRAFRVYAEENERRGAILRRHLDLIGPMSPFLEIGANAGHTSYMLANVFGAEGFALDISADALRHGIVLQDRWNYAKAPVRVAGDALNLPFADGSLRMVLAFQMLSQFLDIGAVFREVTRVLAPGGIFVFAEEPLRRMLTLGLYRAPYVDTMKPWERKLYEHGILGYLVKDVIGAHQEESFGIRQNHSMDLKKWRTLIQRHFEAAEFEIYVRSHGWAEEAVRALGRRIDRHGSDWVPARLLGGTLAAVCRMGGEPVLPPADLNRFERCLRCPDCHSPLVRDRDETLRCGECGYLAANEGGVYNLLRDADRKELYPGDRADVADFSLPGHESKLGAGWHELEGVFGNKYRWMGARATAVLERVRPGPLALRIRGHAHERAFSQGKPVTVAARVNGELRGQWTLGRNGLFVLETPLPDAQRYEIEILASPEWRAEGDGRPFTVNISMLRLVDIAS
jgi:ubiquinone/menaquinone biosynthesis C-methylase UbiE